MDEHLPEEAPPVEALQPTPLIVVDEFQGQGGSYILDPETGIRTLIQRTLPPVPLEAPPQWPFLLASV